MVKTNWWVDVTNKIEEQTKKIRKRKKQSLGPPRETNNKQIFLYVCKTFVKLLLSKKQIDKFKRNHVSIFKLPMSVIIKVHRKDFKR